MSMRRWTSAVIAAVLVAGSLAMGGAAAQAVGQPVHANAAQPSLVGVATEVANDRVDISVTGSGFDDVKALPGQTAPHVYVKLSPKGADLSAVSNSDTAISTDVVNGAISGVLSVPVDELDQTQSYELISWPSRSNPSDANVYARADVAIDWDALFPVVVPAATKTTVKFSSSTFAYNVTKSAAVTVSASGSSRVPTGSVVVRISGVNYPATLKAGKATIKLAKPVKVGTHAVSAVYTSNAPATFKGSTGKATVKVTKASPKLSAAFSKSTVTTKQNAVVKVAAMVPGSLKATASKLSVQVFDGSKKIKTATLNSAGKVNITLPKLKAGSHKVKVKVIGNSNLSSVVGPSRTLKVK